MLKIKKRHLNEREELKKPASYNIKDRIIINYFVLFNKLNINNSLPTINYLR